MAKTAKALLIAAAGMITAAVAFAQSRPLRGGKRAHPPRGMK